MVNARPEHGEIPEHSLDPELSIVETSTKPGPRGPHVETMAVLLTHIDVPVNDGLAINVPSAALTGLTNPGSDLTKMSKAAIALEA